MSIDKKIKIVYMMTSCRNDGPVQQSLNVIKGLDLKKFEPILVTIYKEKEGNSRLDEFLPYVSKHYLVPMSKIDILLRKTSRISEFLNQLKPDIIHTLGVFPDYLVSSIKSSYRQILVLRNYATDDYPDRYGRLKGKVLAKMQILAAKKADVVVACSGSLQKIYQDKMNMKTVAIQNGVDTEKYAKILSSSEKEKLRKKMGISNNNFVWIYTGQFIGRKNIPFMIEGFLKASDKNDRMLLVGGGEKLDEMKKEYKNEEKLIFVGPVNNVRDYLEIADAYVSASRSEGLPNGVLEAMAMGLPVVLSGIPQHKELIANEKESGGLSFELDDMDDYIAKLKSMRSDNVITIGKMARANVKENFDSRETSKKYQDIYIEMCRPICKITLFITSLSDGGAERVTCNLANYLSKHGYLVDVITMSSDAKDTYRLDDMVNRICLLNENEGHFGKVRNFWIRQRRLKEYVKNNQNVSCYIAMLPTVTFMLIRLKKFASGKMLISERNNPGSYGLLKKIMARYSAKKCDGLVVQTKEIGNWYKNVKNKAIIPNAINEDVKLPKRSCIEKKIVAVGRLEKQKNYPMLIKAFAIFSENYPDYKLEIYGKGSQEKTLKKMVKEYDLTGKVVFGGYVKDIAEKIANATCFVMTSNYEGMPNALIEAMCIGVPSIATDCDGGGTRELICDGENGYLVKKDAVFELVERIELVIESKGLSRQLTKNAVKMRQTLSPNVIYDKWLRFIKKMGGEY